MCRIFGALFLFGIIYTAFNAINLVINGEIFYASLWGFGSLVCIGILSGIGEEMQRGRC